MRLSLAAVIAAALLAACSDAESAAPTTSTSTSTTTTSTTTSTTTTMPATSTTTAPVVGAGTGCWTATPPGGVGGLVLDDVTVARGLEDSLVGMRVHAVATADVDGDGWLDLFVGSFGDRPARSYAVRGADGPSPDRLLRGGPEGFRLDESFPGELARTSGAAFADLDGDGDPDLVVARNVRPGRPGRVPTTIYRNDGGTFVPVATVLEGTGARAVGALDHDRDGDLDLFVVEDRFSGGSSRLLANDGAFRFVDVTEAVGLPDDVDGLGLGVADLNGDGWTDLVVGGSNRVFVGGPDGFREAPAPELAWPVYGDEDDVAGVAVGDVNRDGRPDLALGHHYGSTTDDGRAVPVRLYLNDGVDDRGMPSFRDVTDAAGIGGFRTKAPDVQFADLDNDGWLDLVVSASATGAGGGPQPVVLRNLGGDGVPSFEAQGERGDAQYWVTAAVADFDRDGRTDVFVGEFEPDLPSRLFHNASPAGHWVAVDGSGLALGGVGTAVEVRDSSDPGTLLALAEISATTGYAAGAAPIVHVGTGAVQVVDVTIRPPGGEPITLAGLPTDRLVRPPSC